MRAPKFAGFFSKAAAPGPSPLPSGPWHVRQLATKSFFPSSIVLAFTGTGFGRLATEGGALQSDICAKADVIANTIAKVTGTLGKHFDDSAFINFAQDKIYGDALTARFLRFDDRQLSLQSRRVMAESAVGRLRIFTENHLPHAIGLTGEIDIITLSL
jgi:hypothetical protein